MLPGQHVPAVAQRGLDPLAALTHSRIGKPYRHQRKLLPRAEIDFDGYGIGFDSENCGRLDAKQHSAVPISYPTGNAGFERRILRLCSLHLQSRAGSSSSTAGPGIVRDLCSALMVWRAFIYKASDAVNNYGTSTSLAPRGRGASKASASGVGVRLRSYLLPKRTDHIDVRVIKLSESAGICLRVPHFPSTNHMSSFQPPLSLQNSEMSI